MGLTPIISDKLNEPNGKYHNYMASTIHPKMVR